MASTVDRRPLWSVAAERDRAMTQSLHSWVIRRAGNLCLKGRYSG